MSAVTQERIITSMTRPELSILVPHLCNPANDKALALAVACIIDNTSVDYELIIRADRGTSEVYRLYNQMAAQSSARWIVFSNSDVFFAPGWAEPMVAAADIDTIVAGVLVECGAIGVNVQNHPRSFGMLPETFDRASFELWCADSPEIPAGDGWYMPSLHHRETFLSIGGFDTGKGRFPFDELDTLYWQAWRESGRKVVRVGSYAYHLQAFSSGLEQAKDVRHER